MAQRMAYLTFWEKGGKRRVVTCTVEEAKKMLTPKQFERISLWEGWWRGKVTGYIA